jgi:hypothetical protein
MKAAIARRNPYVPIEVAYEEYLARIQRNPPEDVGFNAWLVRQGHTYTEDDWWELLQSIGLDGDEIAEYLENVAEWQP